MQPSTWTGISVVAVTFVSTALCVGASQYGFGLFIAPLENDFGWTRTQISASLSFAAVSGLAAPFLGRLMDRYGARPILVASLIVSAIAFALRPWMTELWQWYALSFLQFIAYAGATVLPMGKLVALWFPTKRGRVMGFAAMGNNFGGLVVAPLIGVALAIGTWKTGFIALAVAAIVIGLVAWFVVREPPRDPSASSTDGGTPTAPVKSATVREALRSRNFYSIFLAVMLGTFTYSAFLPHVFTHLTNEGVPVATATGALSALAIGGILGKIGFGFLAERIGARFAASINLFGQAIFGCVLGFSSEPIALLLITPLFGFFMGGLGVLITLLVQDAFGIRHFGAIMGLISAGHVVSFGLGPIIAGYSFDTFADYAPGFYFTAGLFVMGALTLLFGVRTQKSTGDTATKT
ncbi:MAG: MFS transporter [Pseudomonadota bacterium]